MNRKQSFVPWNVLILSTGETIEKETTMHKLELADLHNRRGNITTVSNRAKANNYPVLTWPEDKELLRVSDLPTINGNPNVPPAWESFRSESIFFVSNDCDLRNKIRVGRAYYRNTSIQHLVGYLIVEGLFTRGDK